MTLEILEPQGVAQPQGMYNHAISVSSGGLLFIAGQVAIDENNQLIGSGDFNAQMEQVFKNIGQILRIFHSTAKEDLNELRQIRKFSKRNSDSR